MRSIFNSQEQLGGEPDQNPVFMQKTFASPVICCPSAHEYIALEPTLYPSTVTLNTVVDRSGSSHVISVFE